MLICIAVILYGTALVYCSLTSTDWRRERENIRAGVGIVIVGCLLVCYQFAYWG